MFADCLQSVLVIFPHLLINVHDGKDVQAPQLE